MATTGQPVVRVPKRDPPVRIIVAEDDFEMRRLVVSCLRKEGYEVLEVADGGELWRRAEEAVVLSRTPVAVDLFVTDIRMPLYTGLEIVSSLRGLGLITPVVLMTAFGSPETRARAAELGAALLEKPFKLEELRALVRRLLECRHATQDRRG